MEIQNYPNYLIYDDGRVYSKKRNIFLKYNTNEIGYKFVDLYNNGKRKNIKVHRLVAIHYIPNNDNSLEVDHIDRDKTNNNVSNLRWVNHSDNINNRGINKNNTSGFKNIYYIKDRNTWIVSYYKICNKRFKTKKEALCYKFIIELKIRANLFI
jgi:hypothetical protein